MKNSLNFALVLFFISVWLLGCEERTKTAGTQNAGPVTGGAVSMGEQLFNANCARCHGAKAGGSEHGPPLVHPVYRPGHHADPSFYMAVQNGSQQHHWQFGDMPPIPGVSQQDVAQIIAFVREEQRRAGIE